MKTNISLILCVSGLLIVSLGSIASAQHEGDIEVGRSGADQLKIGGFVPEEEIVVLPPAGVDPEFWSDIEPGFDHIAIDEPENDLFILQSGCEIYLEVVQVDPAFSAISVTFEVLDDPGEQTFLGGDDLHTHVTWFIDEAEPDFDPLKVLWRATFKLVDTGTTGYSESAPFTFHFAIVDCTRGDCDGSGIIDGGDVQKFVDTVLNPAGAADVDRCRADTNRDGLATPADAASFVDQLLAA